MRRYGGVIAGRMPIRLHGGWSCVIRRQRRCKHDLTQRFHRACMLFGLPMVTARGSPMCMSLNGSTRNGRSSTTVLVLRSVAVVESQSPTIRVVLEAGHVLLAALADARADILLRHVRNAGLPPVRRDSERHLFRPADRLPGGGLWGRKRFKGRIAA